jgi:hypothetical protein
MLFTTALLWLILLSSAYCDRKPLLSLHSNPDETERRDEMCVSRVFPVV